MATNTYVALDKVTLATATSTITFSSIPATYTDLVMVASLSSSGTTYSGIRFNGDTASNYSLTDIYGTGSGVVSSRQANITGGGSGDTSGSGTVLIYQINDYANTTTYKTTISRNGSPSTNVVASTCLWRSTAAINSITIYTGTADNWVTGSTFELYGIRAEGVSPTTKATGGAVYSDSTYYYHVFGASGTFTPTQSITADVLVVAGGGGANMAGGGAGGLRVLTGQTFNTSAHTVTIGSGGSGAVYNGTSTAGVNSSVSGGVLSTITASGGGRSGSTDTGTTYGGNGGSGGGGPAEGARTTLGGTGNAGSYSPVEGFNGGGNGGYTASPYPGGGGGGSATLGGTATSATNAGVGGNGSSAYSSWLSATGVGQNVSSTYYIAGGGAGGYAGGGGTAKIGGYGGGGAGVASGNGIAGTSNTGGGGSGSGPSGTGGNGGSGVVIVRYAK